MADELPGLRWLVLDLDGVVRHWAQPGFRFADIAFEAELLQAAMIGSLTAEAWADEIGRRAAARHGLDPADVAAEFLGQPWTIDDEVVALVHEVRDAGRARVALFSNASTRLEEDLESCGVDAAFDVVCNSARLGVAKPDPGAFRVVAERLGAETSECLFVDDTAPNVHGAREAGMQAEVFESVEGLRALLTAAGLL